MMRRALNTATYLSLLLALVAAGMWVRSRYITEGWESKPRPSGMTFAGSGFHDMWAVESSDGRLVYVRHKIMVRTKAAVTAPPYRHWPTRGRESETPTILGGYYRLASGADAITPLRHNRHFKDYSAWYQIAHTEGRIPGVVHWCRKLAFDMSPPGQYVAVPWLTLTCAGLGLPAFRGWRLWRRWRDCRRPAFPVLAAPS